MRAGGQILDERAQQLLKTLVERYIRDGQPVGSRTLSRDSGLSVSPATVRNVMADLEEMGLLASPHTSAGRIPTARGYRVFVDTLLSVRPLGARVVDEIRQTLENVSEAPRRELVETASRLLSQISHLAGVVTVPRRNQSSFSHLEFVKLSHRRVLAILVIDSREVQNRILQLDRDYSESELRRASNYLNEQFAGRDLETVRSVLIDDLQDTRQRMNQMMIDAISIAQRAFEKGDDDFVLAGETNLMEFAELSDVETLRQLFDVFARKRDILHLLDQCLHAEGVQLFIGEESGYAPLGECSVVTAPYSIDGDVVGVLGVIGPTRMPYEQVISIVDVTARLLGAALKSED